MASHIVCILLIFLSYIGHFVTANATYSLTKGLLTAGAFEYIYSFHLIGYPSFAQSKC